VHVRLGGNGVLGRNGFIGLRIPIEASSIASRHGLKGYMCFY
jgi:hypothetical protein